jgi:hypothetical protein
MAQLVLERIKVHPLLQPLRDAGYPVLISCHADALWAQAIPIGGGMYDLEARIKHPGWFVPVLDSSEDWAWKLANRLAKGIRKKWDERDPNRKPTPPRGLGDR